MYFIPIPTSSVFELVILSLLVSNKKFNGYIVTLNFTIETRQENYNGLVAQWLITVIPVSIKLCLNPPSPILLAYIYKKL